MSSVQKSVRATKFNSSKAVMDQGRLMQILVSPIVSEKATLLAERTNVVAFKVLRDASKYEIRAAVELMFHVEVVSVCTVNIKGKRKRFGKSMGHRSDVRKAYIMLKSGQELNLSGEVA